MTVCVTMSLTCSATDDYGGEMTHFAYVHQRLMRLVVMDDQGNRELDVPLPESTSIRGMTIQELRGHGYYVASKWTERGHYSYAEVTKDATR